MQKAVFSHSQEERAAGKMAKPGTRRENSVAVNICLGHYKKRAFYMSEKEKPKNSFGRI